MAQLSYSIEHRPAIAGGDLADSDLTHRVAAIRNNMTTDLPFGRGVVSDQAAAEAAHPTANAIDGNHLAVKLPDAVDNTLIGIHARDAARAPGVDGFDVNGIRPNNIGSAIRSGKVYVEPEAAVGPTDAVYMRFGASGVTGGPGMADVGKFGKVIDAVTAWVKKTAYEGVGIRRALAGKVYALVTAGTSEDSDTPALSGQTGTGIVDGTAVWDYVGTCDASTRASCVAVTNAKWVKGSLDLAPTLPVTDCWGNALPARLAVLELNLP